LAAKTSFRRVRIFKKNPALFLCFPIFAGIFSKGTFKGTSFKILNVAYFISIPLPPKKISLKEKQFSSVSL
jgi:hypothetical protein